MSRISFKRKTVKLRQVLGIRARLALLAVILVAPLMLERVRSLEVTRSKEIALASSEIVSMAKHSAEATAHKTVRDPNNQLGTSLQGRTRGPVNCVTSASADTPSDSAVE